MRTFVRAAAAFLLAGSVAGSSSPRAGTAPAACASASCPTATASPPSRYGPKSNTPATRAGTWSAAGTCTVGRAEVAGRFEIPNAGPQTWAYPALADGRLYVRRKDHVYVYDVSAKE